MSAFKEYTMMFQLNAKLGGSYSKAFKQAVQELESMQKEIQELSKMQADISAFQKQQAAAEATRKRLEMLRQQYDNIQREMEETGNESADMKNKLLAKQLQIDKTSASLGKQTAKLNEMSSALEEAGINTDDLAHSSEQLAGEIDALKKKEETAAEKANTFGVRAETAFNAVHEAIVAAGVAAALKEIYEYFSDCSQASMDFESAITGVAKTTDLTDSELATMSDSIKALSTEIPATTEEIAAVAEAAGQLGIQKDALLDFTEIMTMLGTATNMTADEAATALARFANITGMATDNYGRLGSVIVDLGNNFATTESEIVAMGTRLASAGKLAGLTEPEIMALAAAMSSVGIEAEAGGTAMTQTLNAIEKAVAKGGDDLAEFARIAGMSSEEFSSAWKNDAMSALTSFIGGLGKLDEQGESTVLVLEDLGLTGIRQSNMIKALGLAADQMTGAVNTANTAWQQNTALTNEANKRYATAQSRLTMMQNAYNNLKVAIGDAYTPALGKSYELGAKVLNSFTEFVQRNPALVNAVTAFAGSIGLVATALAGYTIAIKIARAATAAFATVSTVALGPIFAVTAAVAGAVAVVAAMATAFSSDAVPSVKELTEATRDMREAMDAAKSAYSDTVNSTMAAAGVADTYIDKLEDLQAAGLESEDAQRQYQNTLALLLQVMPSLSDCISQTTDEYGRSTYTLNTSTDALRANTEAWRENAMQQAYQEQLTEMYKQQAAVLIEQQKNSIGLTDAEYKQEEASKRLNDTIARMDELWSEAAKEAEAYNKEYYGMADATNFLSQEYYDLQDSIYDINDEIWTAEKSARNYQKALDENAEAVAAAEEEIALAQKAVNQLNGSMEGTPAASTEFQSAISAVQQKLSSLIVAYRRITVSHFISIALKSVSSQYFLLG